MKVLDEKVLTDIKIRTQGIHLQMITQVKRNEMNEN
jgi:hypothetical protein